MPSPAPRGPTSRRSCSRTGTTARHRVRAVPQSRRTPPAARPPVTRRHVARVVSVCLEEVSAGVLAALIARGDQAAQVHRDVVGLAPFRILYLCGRHGQQAPERGKPQFRAASYARLSETYHEAEPVPAQLANADRHPQRRGWRTVARFKDDGYPAFRRGCHGACSSRPPRPAIRVRALRADARGPGRDDRPDDHSP